MATLRMEELQAKVGGAAVASPKPQKERYTKRTSLKQKILRYMRKSCYDWHTLADICHAVGRRPSTHMRRVLYEMVDEYGIWCERDEADFHKHKRYLFGIGHATEDQG